MSKIEIINRSDWPKVPTEIIARWIVKRAGITWNYRVILRDFGSATLWAGRGGARWQALRVHRRCTPILRIGETTLCSGPFEAMRELGKLKGAKYIWPYVLTENRFKDATASDWSFPVRSRLELLVFLMAHEACHATKGNPRNFQNERGRVDNVDMEMVCNRFGAETVEAFREAWPALLAKWRETAKRIRTANAPDTKLERKLEARRGLLAQWQRKQKLAQTKVKKYQRAIRQCEGRLAAMKGGKK